MFLTRVAYGIIYFLDLIYEIIKATISVVFNAVMSSCSGFLSMRAKTRSASARPMAMRVGVQKVVDVDAGDIEELRSRYVANRAHDVVPALMVDHKHLLRPDGLHKTPSTPGCRCAPRSGQMDEFCSEYHMKGMGCLWADVSIHAEYTSDPSTCMAVAEYGKANNLNAHIHLSETKNEHEGCRARHGKTPAEYFSDLGLFDIPCTAAHCVWLEDEDFDILHEKGVTVASCPVSNMKLASGIADTAKMIDKGINLALGTDSVASNNSLNFFEEMKFMALGIKA